MKWDENKALHWIMRWGWMRWKQNLAFNNDDENYVQIFTKKDEENYVQIFTKKNFNFPTPSTFCLSVPMSLSEIEIK